MERYRAVNTRAEQAATQPFQQYSTDPSAFVAPLTSTQQAAIQNVGAAQNIAQPYYQAGAGLTLSGAQGVGPLTQQQIGYYQNPYTQAVAGTTFDALRQQQQQEMQGATANAIRSGAFGGDRAGLVAANLARQQQLGTAQAMAPIFERGYAQALQTAQGQQGVAAQDLQRQLAAGQQIAGLGTGATQTALQAAQGLLGAGTAEQQTQQAGQSALYNQFLQERGYPFQVAQFLANIAMGTGALSGSTTTTQQPVPFFSDEREKTNVQHLGKGLYAYDYIDDVEAAERGERPMPPKRVGPMAQDIEERAPGLVGEVGGHKVVKGLSPESMGGAVLDLEPGEYRSGYAPGGLVSSDDIRAILDAQKAAFAPFAQAGLYGGSPQQGGAGKPGYVPGGLLPVPKLMTAGPVPKLPDSIASQVMSTGSQFGITPKSLYDMGEKGLGALRRSTQTGPSREAPPPPVSPAAPPPAALSPVEYPQNYETDRRLAYGGLVGYAEGGGVDKDDPMSAYGPQGPGIAIPTEQPDIKPLEPAKPPSPPNSILGDILGVAKTAASIYSMSDERMKRGMEPVGELYNGLPVYKYRMGDGPTQIGLSAQEASGLHPGAVLEGPDGLLRLNYDRATRAYGGGLAPRMGYQVGGAPSFEDALRRTLAYEGGYAEDTGGPTMMGISSRANPDVDLRRVKEDPEYRASIYRERYWNPIGAEKMDPRMANVAFDTAVNLGVGRTRQLLEQAENDPVKLLRLRQQHYQNLIQRDPETYGQYGRGWTNRVNDLMSYAGGEPVSPAGAAITKAAGEGRGLAGAPQVRGEAAPAEERGLIASLLPTKFGTRTVATPKGEQFGSLGEFLTSRQFIQPLFEGVGAMASSPNLSGWGAALQGLGAASRAYTGLEKEMADVGIATEQKGLVSQQSRSQIAQQISLLSNIPPSNFIIALDRNEKPIASTSGEMYMTKAEFDRRLASGEIREENLSSVKPAGNAPKVEDGSIRKGDIAPRAPAVPPVGAPDVETKTPSAPGAGPAQQQRGFEVGENGIPVVVPDYKTTDEEISKIPTVRMAFDPRDAQKNKINPRAIQGVVETDRALSLENRKVSERFTGYQGNIENVDRALVDAKKYITAFSEIPETGAAARGKTLDQRANAIRIYDVVSRIFGGEGISPDVEGALSAKEILEKLRNQLSTAEGGQFKADEARRAILNSLPGTEITEKAGLTLLSTVITQAQRQKDLVNFMRAYQNRYGVLVGAEDAFSKQVGKKYENMRSAIINAYKMEEKTLPSGRKIRMSAVDALKNGILTPEKFENVTGGGFGFRRVVME